LRGGHVPSLGASTSTRGSLLVPLLSGSAMSQPNHVDSNQATLNEKGIDIMSEKQIWLITGAGRGMGTDIARAALAAGHAVVATGRNPDRVAQAVGEHDDLLVVALDV